MLVPMTSAVDAPTGGRASVHVVVMGVSGSGKSTIAAGIAVRTGWVCIEADDAHAQESVAKMASGKPLTDEDRRPWLADLSLVMAEHAGRGEDTVMACSALKRAHREVLRRGVAALDGGHRVFFVHLAGTKEVLAERLEARRDHFMPASLLCSQFEALEDLGPDEDGVVLDLTDTPHQLIDAAVEELHR